MKTKRWLSVMIVAAWLVGSTGNAQQYGASAGAAQPYGAQSTFPPPAPLAANGTPAQPERPVATDLGGLSDWILYRRSCCEGQPGKVTPLYTELYLSSGPSIPVGGMTLSRELTVGWSIVGGARALFFNEAQTSAWVVDAHIINTNERSASDTTQFPILFFNNGVPSNLVNFEGKGTGRNRFSVLSSNRTMVGLGVGRDWFAWKLVDSDSCSWRWGVDAGGRYGTHRVNFNEFGHVTDVVGGLYAGIHSNIEIPCRYFIASAGFRFEWAYTFSDILQRTSDVQDLNLLFTGGIRY